jgi:hypothetical protein
MGVIEDVETPGLHSRFMILQHTRCTPLLCFEMRRRQHFSISRMDADIVVDHGGAEDPPIGTWRGLRADGV